MTEKVEFWGIVELFGHSRIAGMVSEFVIGGQGFIRVDVPRYAPPQPSPNGEERPFEEGEWEFTRFFGAGAIYSMTPVSEEVAKAAAQAMQVRPVTIYLPMLSAKNAEIEAEYVGPDEAQDWLEDEMDPDDDESPL